MALSCSKKTISIIKPNNEKSEKSKLPSFFHNIKKNWIAKKVSENKDFWNVIIPSEDTIILKLNQYQKSDNPSFIIHANLECIIEKIDGCKNKPKNLSVTKVSKHIASDFPVSTISSFIK